MIFHKLAQPKIPLASVFRTRSHCWRSKPVQAPTTPCRRWNGSSSSAPAPRGMDAECDLSKSAGLDKIIRDTIKATGPMSVSTYMQLCLSHPTGGYYMSPLNPVFGPDGDFVTSPEISQVFGELLAVWHLSRWIAAGKPKKLRIVELGPGRGTLMHDALHTWGQFSDCLDAIHSIHLVETSPIMRELQSQKLKSYIDSKGLNHKIFWQDSIEDLIDDTTEVDNEVFTMVIAHEFFDALPIHLLEKHESGWHEIQISDDPDPTAKEIINGPNAPLHSPPFRFVRSPDPTPSAMLLGGSSPRFVSLPIGTRIEISPVSFKIARQVAELINNPKSAGGSALIVDYGDEKAYGGSFRAFKRHTITDVFNTPGRCDLTANVDFAYLKEAIDTAASTHGPITQAAFLFNMNIGARIAKLINQAGKKGTKRKEVGMAAQRLLDPTGMGGQYKVLGVTGTGGRTSEETEVWPFVPGIRER